MDFIASVSPGAGAAVFRFRYQHSCQPGERWWSPPPRGAGRTLWPGADTLRPEQIPSQLPAAHIVGKLFFEFLRIEIVRLGPIFHVQLSPADNHWFFADVWNQATFRDENDLGPAIFLFFGERRWRAVVIGSAPAFRSRTVCLPTLP